MNTSLKLFLYLSFTVFLFIFSGLMVFTLLTAIAAVVCVLHRQKSIRAGALPIGLFLAATFLSNALFSDGRVVASFIGIYISDEGLKLAALRTSRLFLLIFGAKLFMIYVTPVQLQQTLCKVLLPLRKLKIPVDDFMEILALTLQAVPLLKNHLVKSFKEKNSHNTNGGLMDKTRVAASLLLPTLILIITTPERIFRDTKAL
ncbi:MAG: energy-coupling factor transporter transmembrane protein EcfT [Nitrospirae bacterium YQR-1]